MPAAQDGLTYISQINPPCLDHDINMWEGEWKPRGSIQRALKDGRLRQDDAVKHVSVPDVGQVKLTARCQDMLERRVEVS